MKTFVIVIIILFALGLLYLLLELFEHKAVKFNSFKLKSDYDRELKICVISDLHSNRVSDRTITKILMEAPHIVLIAGDLVNHKDTNYDNALDLVNKLSENTTVIYSFGNHELTNRHYNRAGFEDFLNEIRQNAIVVDNNTVNVCGLTVGGVSLDCGVYRKGRRKPVPEFYYLMLESLGFKNCDILMTHNPEYSKKFAERFAPKLIVGGHLHGGHVNLPFVGGILLTSIPFTKYKHGLYREGDTDIFVSRGLGSHFIPLRFLNRCEVSFLETKSHEM